MRKLWVVGLFAVIVAGVVGGCLVLTGSQNNPSPSPAKYIGDGALFLSSPPALGQTTTLTYTIWPRHTYSNAPALILLSEGFVWVDNGSVPERSVYENKYLVQVVNLSENIPTEITGVIKSVKTGRWNITALVTYDYSSYTFEEIANSGIAVPAGAGINVTVTENSAHVENGFYWPTPQHENMMAPN
jgi:hypothetical protein